MKRLALCFLGVCCLCFLRSAAVLADSQSTSAIVDFTSGYTVEPVQPVDPDKPGDVFHPNSGTGSTGHTPGATGASGWLSINYVTPLVYGTEIEDGVYTVQQERPYLQTSDLRGTATGWKVTAIASPFHSPEDAAAVPALLCLQDGDPNSTYHPFYDPPKIPEKIELPANGSSQRLIEFADAREGVGIWVVRWYPANHAGQDFQLRLFSPVSYGKLGFVLWVMNDAP